MKGQVLNLTATNEDECFLFTPRKAVNPNEREENFDFDRKTVNIGSCPLNDICTINQNSDNCRIKCGTWYCEDLIFDPVLARVFERLA